MSLYNDSFYIWVNDTALRSANALLPVLSKYISPTSVLDIGCGRGAWLSVWKNFGVQNVLGIDGSYVLSDSILIERNEFIASDLTVEIPVDRTFDLVQCLEVAEHLEPTVSEQFIKKIASHSNFVLFSAAQPGQGGENHINERMPSFWAKVFEDNGFYCYDFLRPEICQNENISKWYRYNILFFVRSSISLNFEKRHGLKRISDFRDLDSFKGDFSWEFRRYLLRVLPVSLVTFLSRINYKYLKRS